MSNLVNFLTKLIRYDPRFQIALILFIISLYTIFVGDFYQESVNTYVAVLTAVVLDGLILRYQKNKWVIPYSGIVTGFLVGLILNPSFPAGLFILVAAIAITSKYFILPGKKHIFNPAAFGLITASIFFSGAISWWGVSWSPHLGIFLFITAGYVLLRLRRIWLPIGFLLIYWLFLASQGGPVSPIQGGILLTLISDPTVALFALVMIPEPQTSPIRNYFRYSFGILVAVLLIIFSLFLPSSSPDPLLTSLLTANLITFVWLRLNR